jgi:hypothetical protein
MMTFGDNKKSSTVFNGEEQNLSTDCADFSKPNPDNLPALTAGTHAKSVD